MTGAATVLDSVADPGLDDGLDGPALSFELPDELVATAPIEAAGGRRDDARLLVAWRRDQCRPRSSRRARARAAPGRAW